MLLLFYSMIAFGIAYCIGASKISLMWRTPLADTTKSGAEPGAKPQQFVGGMIAFFLLTLIECPACTGFWLGVGFARLEAAREFLPGSLWITAWLWGFWTVASNLLLARLAGISAQEGEQL